MKDFFLFNAIGISLMMLGLYFILEMGDNVGVFMTFVGLFSVLLGYKRGFEDNK